MHHALHGHAQVGRQQVRQQPRPQQAFHLQGATPHCHPPAPSPLAHLAPCQAACVYAQPQEHSGGAGWFCCISLRRYALQIGVGQVIKGWEEGVAQMSKGERANLTCTPDYAYGARGYPPVIPPDSTLIFDVELIDFK